MCVRDHPRTRGVYGPGRPEGGPGRRIIPAHAGFTTGRSRPTPHRADHPRTRGVYPIATDATSGSYGSSPHTRGLLSCRRPGAEVEGIIPAHAGFTTRSPPCRSRPPDHPRTRGVYAILIDVFARSRGSSPHTRGLPENTCPRDTGVRIIPAHAGFTHAGPPAWPCGADHPRTRGVYYSRWAWVVVLAGSSPHTRGLPSGMTGSSLRSRIIPAHAGFTRPTCGTPRPAWDHPRTRGVYFSTILPRG